MRPAFPSPSHQTALPRCSGGRDEAPLQPGKEEESGKPHPFPPGPASLHQDIRACLLEMPASPLPRGGPTLARVREGDRMRSVPVLWEYPSQVRGSGCPRIPFPPLSHSGQSTPSWQGRGVQMMEPPPWGLSPPPSP